MNNKICVGLIGCGRMGKMHLEILSKIPDFIVKSVIDPNVDVEFVQQYGINNVARDINVVLSDPEINAVIIAAPSVQHIEIIEASAKAKKHIFCEKPVSFDINKIKSIIKVVDECEVKCQVGFNRRFDPSLAMLRDKVSDGLIGNIQLVNIVNRDPRRPEISFIPRSGGLFLDFNVHDFDTIRYVTGLEVNSVYAMGANLIDPVIGELGDIDTNTITLELNNGALCSIDSSREAVYGYDQRVEVFGGEGSLSSLWQRNHEVIHLTAQSTHQDTLQYSFVERYQQAYIDQMLAFRDYINNDISNPADLGNAMIAVDIANAAAESFKENKEIAVNNHQIQTSKMSLEATNC